MPPLTPPARLVLTVDSVGGVWRYGMDVAGELARRGTAVTVAGMGPPPSPGQAREAADAGIELIWLDVPLDWTDQGARNLQQGARAVERACRERAPALLHLNTPTLAALFERPPPCVVAAHSCLATWWQAMRCGPLPTEWEANARQTAAGLAAADVVVAPTHAFAAQLRECHGPLPSLRVVPNGCRPIPAAGKEALVLSAGRWWDEAKNLAALDAAARTIRWPVHVAGPLAGPGNATAPPAHARWLGTLDHREMAACLAGAALFVSTARYEPFGLAVLEAASAGAALVLSDMPGFRELWGGCALFVDPARPHEIAGAANRLIDDAALREAMGELACRRAGDFTIARQVDALSDAYAAAASGRLQTA